MAERQSVAARIRLRNLAEVEIQRHAGDHAAWHKHLHDVDLDPVQVLKMTEMDRHKQTIDFSCRRTRKTSVKELYFLEHNARHSDQALGIVAPRETQAINNLNYHLDAIRRSPVLKAFLNYKNGRRQIGDTYYQFANRSRADTYGIMAQIDGDTLTTASLEEVDDMPHDRLFSRFLLMLGATQRLGANQNARTEPQVRITGVFKGADALTDMIDSGKYHILPTVDAYLGMEMGIIHESFMLDMRDQLSADEYIRQLLCVNVSSRNLIWESWVRKALQTGLAARLEQAQPLPGERYKKRGLISFGYDHSGHGEEPQSSKYALVVTEQIGNFLCFPFAKIWAPGTDEMIVKNDVKAFWRYFDPDAAIGDAYGVGMLTQLNDELFNEGLTYIDRRAIGDGDSTASTWTDWAFAPLRFEGMTKHQMAAALRSVFNNGHAAIPYIDDLDPLDPDTADLRLLLRQLTNIRPVPTKASYSSYKMVRKLVGDDLFDAAMASVWALAIRGATLAPTSVLTRTATREQLLGNAA